MSAHVRTHRHIICVISSAHLSRLSVTLQAAGKCVSSEGTSRASSLLLCALRQALEPQRVQRVSSEGTSRVPHCVSILCARLSSLSGYSVYRLEGTSRVSRASLLCARLSSLSGYSVYRQKVPHAPPHCIYVLCARLSSLSGYSVYRQKVPHAPHTPHGSVLGSRASAGTVCIVRRYLTRLTRLTALCQALEPQRVRRVSSTRLTRLSTCRSRQRRNIAVCITHNTAFQRS